MSAALEISELIEPRAVVELHGTTPAAVFEELCEPLAKASGLARAALVSALLAREKLGSTGIGHGVAIPHARIDGLPQMLIGFGRSASGIDFASIDGKPAQLFTVVFCATESAGMHLKVLARVSSLLKDAALRDRLMQARDGGEILRTLALEEANRRALSAG